MEFFTSFNGRISQKSFWRGILGIVIVFFVFIITLRVAVFKYAPMPGIIPLGALIALVYPALAICVKRLHDRNKPAMPWVAIFFVPGFISNIMQALRIDYTTVSLAGVPMLAPGPVATVVVIISLVVGIWALVELGLLKGSDGENSYGPNPLG